MSPRKSGEWPSHTQGGLALPVTPDQRKQIVAALADGQSRERIAERMHLPFDSVMRVATAHGYPNRAALRAAALALEEGIEPQAVTSDEAQAPSFFPRSPAPTRFLSDADQVNARRGAGRGLASLTHDRQPRFRSAAHPGRHLTGRSRRVLTTSADDPSWVEHHRQALRPCGCKAVPST